jgi:pyruvate dehydrogenase (quinone)
LDANPEFGIDLQPIDFALHAQACGAAGFTIEDPKEAAPVLRQALSHPGPAIIQAVVDPNEPPMPGNVTLEQSIHFAEALLRGGKKRTDMIKTIAENKVREVI